MKISCKKRLVLALASMLTISTFFVGMNLVSAQGGEDVGLDYSDSFSDLEDDVFYYYYQDNEWGWKENVNRPDIDITRASIEEIDSEILVSLEVKGTVRERSEIWYSISLEDENSDSYQIMYSNGTGYLQYPSGGFSINPSGFGTSIFQVRFSPAEVGNPSSLEIVEVETHDWIDAEGEGEYYYDTSGPQADEPGTSDSEGSMNPEDVLNEIIARGMMCIVLAILIPIVIIVIIIVVLIKLLGSEEEGRQERPPPPREQSSPRQSPPPPDEEGGVEKTPPPPPEDD